MNVIISIIIPVFNSEKYLRECLDSIKNQELDDWEAIIVDDCSTDNSISIINEYLSDKRFVLVSQTENQGVGAARKKAMEYIHGEYIGFVDSDDTIEPDMFSKLCSAAKEEDADIAIADWFEGENRLVFDNSFAGGVYDRIAIERILLPRLVAHYDKTGKDDTLSWALWYRIFRRDFIKRNNILFNEALRTGEEFSFVLPAMSLANRVVYLKGYFGYHLRLGHVSLTRSYKPYYWVAHKEIIRFLLNEQSIKCIPNYDKQVALRILSFVIWALHNEYKAESGKCVFERRKNCKLILSDEYSKWIIAHLDENDLEKEQKIVLHAISNEQYNAIFSEYEYNYWLTKGGILFSQNKLVKKVYKRVLKKIYKR